MKLNWLFNLLITIAIGTNTFAQKEPEFGIALLENDNISSVNINQESFIKSLGEIMDISKEEFKDIDEAQKMVMLITAHKTGEPTIKIYSNPALNIDQEEQFIQKIQAQKLENTKLVDFPMLFLINTKPDEVKNTFIEFISPEDKRNQEYAKADLKQKFRLNKEYAIEVLSVLGAFQVDVDKQFAGVRNFGETVNKTNFSKEQNISDLADKNSAYWRAVMEMSVNNQLVPVTKIFMLCSQGEFDYAHKFIEIVSGFSESKTVADTYLKKLSVRLSIFRKEVDSRINEGITLHDQGKYKEAIAIYDALLSVYPNSAWAKYEKYFSEYTSGVANKEIEIADRDLWDKAKIGVYKSNPMYNLDVRASGAKETYFLMRRTEIQSLFKDAKNKFEDLYTYADIALDLEVYDFSAQLFWILITFDKRETDALYKYLYSLEKLGVSNLKDNFKGDFKKEFKKIEKAQEEAIDGGGKTKSSKK